MNTKYSIYYDDGFISTIYDDGFTSSAADDAGGGGRRARMDGTQCTCTAPRATTDGRTDASEGLRAGSDRTAIERFRPLACR